MDNPSDSQGRPLYFNRCACPDAARQNHALMLRLEPDLLDRVFHVGQYAPPKAASGGQAGQPSKGPEQP